MRTMWVALGLVACAEPIQLEDEGVLCVGSGAGLEAGRVAVQVVATVDACEANVFDSRCTAEWDGGTEIVVHTAARVVPIGGETGCDLPIDLSCETEPLPEGTYTFHHGSAALEVALPSDPAPDDTCTGEAP